MSLYLLPTLLSIAFIYGGFTATQAYAQNTLTYTEQAFDSALDKLPPQYIDHDPQRLFNALKVYGETDKKTEFETTEEFRTRIHKQQSIPILGDLTIGNIFALQVQVIRTYYDADRKILEVVTGLQDYLTGEKYKRLTLKEVYHPKTYYEGTNAFGIRVTVEVISSQLFNIILSNVHKYFPPVKYIAKEYRDKGIKDHILAYDAYIAKINMDVSSAKSAKENIRLLAICKVTPPFAFIEEFNPLTKATIDRPVEIRQTDSYIYTRLWPIRLLTGSHGVIVQKPHAEIA